MSTTHTHRIGPQMQRAIEFVAAHPGCSKIDVARHVLPRAVGWDNWHAYGPVNRAIAAGRILAFQGRGNAYSLRVPSDPAATTPTPVPDPRPPTPDPNPEFSNPDPGDTKWRVLEIALSLQEAAFRDAEHTAREADQAVSTTRRAAERAADGITPPPNP